MNKSKKNNKEEKITLVSLKSKQKDITNFLKDKKELYGKNLSVDICYKEDGKIYTFGDYNLSLKKDGEILRETELKVNKEKEEQKITNLFISAEWWDEKTDQIAFDSFEYEIIFFKKQLIG